MPKFSFKYVVLKGSTGSGTEFMRLKLKENEF